VVGPVYLLSIPRSFLRLSGPLSVVVVGAVDGGWYVSIFSETALEKGEHCGFCGENGVPIRLGAFQKKRTDDVEALNEGSSFE
jgi:hypothetical protein